MRVMAHVTWMWAYSWYNPYILGQEDVLDLVFNLICKLINYLSCVMGAHRKHKLPGSETTDYFTHSTASSISTTCFNWSPCPLPKSHGYEATWTLMGIMPTAFLYHGWRTLSLETPLLLNSKQACLLLGERCDLMPPGCQSQTQLWELVQVKSHQNFMPSRMCGSLKDPRMAVFLDQIHNLIKY